MMHKNLGSRKPGWMQHPIWESAAALKVAAQFAESRQDDTLSGAGQHRFVFQVPGVFVRDIDGIQAELERGINVAARAVTDHTAMRFYDLIFVDKPVVRLVVLLAHDFDEFKESLQTGALDFRGLFGRLAFCK